MKKSLYVLLLCGLTSGVFAGCSNTGGGESVNTTAENSSVQSETTVKDTLTVDSGENVQNETNDSQGDAAADYGNLITTIQAGTNEILLYYPTPNTADTSGVITICTSPTIFVFGDEKYDNQEAIDYANESGLAKLAAENGSSVCFVNPIEDTWSEKDADAYANAAAAILSTTQDPVKNGVVTRIDTETQEEIPSIAGNQSRIYVYGIGRGADYIADSALKSVSVKMFFGYDVDVTPSACLLEECTNISSIEKNDIPVVSVNNSDEINTILKENCGSVAVESSQDYEKQFNDVMKHYRRQCSRLVNVYDWKAEGIIESIETCEVKTSPDNASELYKGTETHPINYIVYYDENLDVTNGNVPLVLIFHGGGNSALHEAMMTDWPMIGKKNGFITCSVDNHSPNCTATEIVELIDILKSKYSIDESRIYASGFSMGGVKCWDLYTQYPEIFAGLAPMDASNAVGTDTYDNVVEDVNTDTLVPIFYVGGETSPLEELPFKSEKVTERIREVFDVNDVAAPYNVEFSDVENWSNKIWGVNGDLSYDITDTVFTDSVLNVQLYKSTDGHYYTALASASNQAHEIYARNSWAAWDFLSQFSRNEDNQIEITTVDYGLSSDDGQIKNNSYNE